MSPAVVDTFLEEDGAAAGLAAEMVREHRSGNWGEVEPLRVEQNRRALQMGGPIISVFVLPVTQARVLIVTNREADYTRIMREYEWMP